MTTPKGTTQGPSELPLAVIDAIDKWMHQQTRFHLPDTDGYKEMLAEVSRAIGVELTKARLDELSLIYRFLPGETLDMATVIKHIDSQISTLNTQLESHKQKGKNN